MLLHTMEYNHIMKTLNITKSNQSIHYNLVVFYVYQVRGNARQVVHYQKLNDDVEACMEDGCLREVNSFLIMDTSEGIIPLTPWSLTLYFHAFHGQN